MASVKKDPKTGKWYCRSSYKDEFGNYKQITRKGFSTKKEATLKGNAIDLSIKDGTFFENQKKKIPFAEYFENWVNLYKIDRGFSASTEKKYLINIKLVKEYFGTKTFDQITRAFYQGFLDKRGVGRSKDTVEKAHYQIKSCVQDAIFEKITDTDFTYRARITFDLDALPPDEKFWNLDDFQKIIGTLKSDLSTSATILYTQALTGMRIGEVYALKWEDIDRENKMLSIRANYLFKEKGFSGGKTYDANRKIIIPPELLTRFSQHQLLHQMGHKEYLFLDAHLTPILTYEATRNYLKRLCKRIEVKYLSPHSLRHTHCSLLIHDGVDIGYISKRLGHKNVTETLKTYSHIIKEMAQRENVKAIQSLSNFAR